MGRELQLPKVWNNDNPAAHLLSREERSTFYRYTKSLKEDIEQAREKRNTLLLMIQLHEKRVMRIESRESLIEQHCQKQRFIDLCSSELKAYNELLEMDREARDILGQSLTYLENVNLSFVELTQQTLF
jgi:hypothetical protein